MGLIQLFVVIILLWLIVWGVTQVFPNFPATGQRILYALAAVCSFLLILSAFGILPIGTVHIR